MTEQLSAVEHLTTHRERRHAFLLYSPAMAGFSVVECNVLCAVVSTMDSEWPDLTFRALLDYDEGEYGFEAVDPAYLTHAVAFHYVCRDVDVATKKDALEIVGRMHEFPLTAHGLIALVRRVETHWRCKFNGLATTRQVWMIKHLTAGARYSVEAMCQRHSNRRASRPEDLTPKQAHGLIEAFKDIADREKA